MSDREASQVTDNVAPGGTTDRAVPFGNRPAQDARQVDTPEQVDTGWHGGDDATDFLGLDLEVAPTSAAPNAAASETAPAPAAAPVDPASNSWLMSLDAARAAEAGFEPVAPAAEQAIEQVAEESTEEEASPEVAQPLDATWPELSTPRRARSPRVLWIAAGFVAACGLAAYQFRDRWMPAPSEPLVALTPPNAKPSPAHDASKHGATPKPSTTDAAISKSARVPQPSTSTSTSTPDTTVVKADASTTTTAPNADATNPPTSDASAHPLVADADIGVDAEHASTPRPAADRIESWLRAQRGPEIPGSDLGMSPHVQLPFMSAALDEATSTTTGDANDREPTFGMSRSPLTNHGAPFAGVEGAPQPLLRTRAAADHAPRISAGGLRHASAADLAGVWEGSVIPMDAIGAPSRLLTPGVGRVRVVIQRGEIFEGKLYAVGEGKVWIDTGLGRLALLSEQVERIEHLSSPAGTPGLGAPGSQELAGLPRVRVHTPGGTFYGKVIARDDATVTLITDQGARVMLESRDVESAPVGLKSVLVKPATAKR